MDVELNKDVAGVEELSEREIAIAQGMDPDLTPTEPAQEPEEEEAGTAEVGQDAEVADEQPDGDKEVATWYGDDDLELAGTYGLSADDLEVFASKDEFAKVTRLLDKAQTWKQAKEPDPEPETSAENLTNSEEQDDFALDPDKYVEAGYDDETVNLVRYTKRLHDELSEVRSRLAAQEKEQQERQERDFIDAFHNTVDSMDEELFGRSAKMTDSANENRKKLFETAVEIHSTLAAQGRAPSLPVLLRRAEAVAFGEQILERERKNLKAELAEQSRRRRRVAGATRPRGAPAPAAKGDDDIVNHPEIVAAWERMQEEAGV